MDHLEEISRKVQEGQTPITELEGKFEDLPRKIQEAEIAITRIRINMESNQTNPGTNIMEYFKRLINNWIICPLQAVLDPSSRVPGSLSDRWSSLTTIYPLRFY